MKNIYLICNAHIDPVWQWDWDEGTSTVLSTFYSAVNLLKKYNFEFNHNEVYLYELIEKNDPKLFKEIQELVKQGKWNIMGGWYIQPDCMVPSGESFIRQITLGREYFKDKFGVRVTTANNFDAFAHTKGLATILNKCGYDSYIFCRPMANYDPYSKTPLPKEPFIWKGYDGSKITCLRTWGENLYLTIPGKAKEQILEKINFHPDEEDICVLWGIGNHGGGPSRKDLEDIETLKKERPDLNIIHTSLEEYFKIAKPKETIKRQLICLMKSFSSVSNIKQIHDKLENQLYLTEKVCSIADLEGTYKYNKQVLKDAERALCQIEFHDVLSGTAIKTGTDSSYQVAYRAIENLKDEFFTAFNSLAKHLPSATPEYEGLVFFNHNPFEYNGLVEVEFYAFPALEDVLNEHYKLTFYDINNNEIPYQICKEESELNSDRRKKVFLNLKIPACSPTLVTIKKEIIKGPKIRYHEENNDNDIVIKDEIKEVIISRKTGALISFKMNDKEFIKGDSCVPYLFNDDPDPWGWNLTRFDDSNFTYEGQKVGFGNFKRIPLTKGKLIEGKTPVLKIEDGEMLVEVQAIFETKKSHILISYLIYKNKPFIDVKLHTLWQDGGKGLKLGFNINGDKNWFAQAAFGIEEYKADKKEQPGNRYVGSSYGDDCFTIYNRSGIHSYAKNGSKLTLTLFNGSLYCAHPMFNYTPIIAEPWRYTNYIELGTHDYEFRVGVNKIEECEINSKLFNEPIYGMYYFPHGDNQINKDTILLTNKNIVISALKRRTDNTYLIRLYNGSSNCTSTNLSIKNSMLTINFNKFEFKTFVFDGQKIVESKDASIY